VADKSAPIWVMTDDVCWCFEDDSVDEIEHEMARDPAPADDYVRGAGDTR
jgi:hypothetical protein